MKRQEHLSTPIEAPAPGKLSMDERVHYNGGLGGWQRQQRSLRNKRRCFRCRGYGKLGYTPSTLVDCPRCLGKGTLPEDD